MPHFHEETLRQVWKEHTLQGTAKTKEYPQEQKRIPLSTCIGGMRLFL